MLFLGDVNRSPSAVIYTLALLSTSNALILPAAIATSTCYNVGLIHKSILNPTPRPTAITELRVRQAQVSLATCGFINGDGDLAVTCNSNYYCATTSTYVGCCEKNNCLDIFTRCYDLLGSVCDQACQNNPQNLICPSSLPYCARYNYESGSVGLGCAKVTGYTTTVLLSTKSAIGGFTTSSSSSTSTPGTGSSSSGLSTGATAGIAVGATLGVVAVLLLAWFFWRRHRKSKQMRAQADLVVPYHDAKEVDADTRPDRNSKMSELPSSPRTPLSPEFYATQQPRHGLPKYTQNSPIEYYEMAGEERPISYPTTELSSNRG